jgi:nicotinic acetylcholine receptor
MWPAFLITALAIMGVFSPFNESGKREEKVTLGLTTLLTMAVILMIITNQMPKSSTGMPLLGKNLSLSLSLSQVITYFTSLIANNECCHLQISNDLLTF